MLLVVLFNNIIYTNNITSLIFIYKTYRLYYYSNIRVDEIASRS